MSGYFGVSAIVMARRVYRKEVGHGMVIVWNLIGATIIVPIGIILLQMGLPGAWHVFSDSPAIATIFQFPMALAPTVVVMGPKIFSLIMGGAVGRSITRYCNGVVRFFMKMGFHFTFTGKEPCEVSVRIKDKEIKVDQTQSGKPDLHLIADSETWLRFLAKKERLLLAVLRKKIRIKGPLKLMQAFAKCFPS